MRAIFGVKQFHVVGVVKLERLKPLGGGLIPNNLKG